MAMTAPSARPPPVSTTRLRQIAEDACTSTLSSTSSYNHAQTPSWNSNIISRILESLLASAQTSTGTSAQYKYAVNSTIIQHIEPAAALSKAAAVSTAAGTQTISPPSTPAPSSDEAAVQPPADESAGNGEVDVEPNGAGVTPQKGRRGMHSATGAYWNNDTDGMWSYKFDGGEAKGMDVVISVIWIAV